LDAALVIGDIHGCAEEFAELLRLHGSGRRVVLVGDLVAKGPDSKGVIALAREVGALAVRGNHEMHVLRWREAKKRRGPLPVLRPHHQAVVEVLGREDWAYIEAMPFTLALEDFGVRVVHAGLVPGRSLERQDPSDMVNMRSLLPNGTASKRIEEGVPWASRWPGPEHVLFGHDAVRGLQQYEFATGLDTGCVYGKALTGMLLPERALVSVKAKRMWSDPFRSDE
jgi:hypothetical protein